MKAIIFGINGQDGYYLNQLLALQRIEVIGISRVNAQWITGDVGHRTFVEQLIRVTQPEFIFHLAANSTIRHNAALENYETITTGSLNILETVYKYSRHSKVFLSGSGLQFVNRGKPISENDQFEGRDPYSVSRIQSIYWARYFRSLGIKVYVGYFFHHDSPFRSENHLSMKIAKTALRIKNGSDEVLKIGDLQVIKEYNFAGDFMEAVLRLVNQDKVFECVIGSGVGFRIQEWIEICFNFIEMDWEKHIEVTNIYTPDFKKLVSDPRTIFSLGWQPTVDIGLLAKKLMMSN